MIDPTIYENLKVVLQGSVYDLDMNGVVHILDRQDIIDLARMSRTFKLRIRDAKSSGMSWAEIRLTADTQDLAGEMLELQMKEAPGCKIEIVYEIAAVASDAHTESSVLWRVWQEKCSEAHERIQKIWDNRPQIKHQTVYDWNPQDCGGKRHPQTWIHRLHIDFNRKIDENQLEDIPHLLQLMIQTLREADDIYAAP